MTTFYDFIKERRKPTSIIGQFSPHTLSRFSRDFMDDARGERGLRKIESFDQLYGYLRERNACDGAIEGALDTWRDYTLWRIREGHCPTF